MTFTPAEIHLLAIADAAEETKPRNGRPRRFTDEERRERHRRHSMATYYKMKTRTTTNRSNP